MPKDQNASLSVSRRDVVFNGKIWDVVSETFDYQGQKLVREFVAHPGAVAVIALNEQQEILLIKQYRHPVREYLWEVPAGLLDMPGESRLEAAKRELLEETGYIANDWQGLIEFHTTPGGNDETISIFLAKDLRLQGHDFELEGEEVDLEVRWVPLADALSSVMQSQMRSPSAGYGIMALAHQLGVSIND
ncbi:NUDIX domain-containing protein [Rhodoluna lacicola]|uniref:NUDIX domain-containing protein n=1 Tax=Rhodoluna lacicola TaxID=529884 RepID=UPI00222F42C6|nr:NUDIX hydrolase [Rhodoluna lacicola]BDS50595.1 NUDIX hydrolase [Rhodoluna lacicola]